ncbi:MAG: DUF6384 family protein [Planctomycetota bacterium]
MDIFPWSQADRDAKGSEGKEAVNHQVIAPCGMTQLSRGIIEPSAGSYPFRVACHPIDAVSRLPPTLSDEPSPLLMSRAHAQQSPDVSAKEFAPELSLQETLRVMDVAREMRDQRQLAEEMFRRDDLRAALRDKLMRTANMMGDDVTEAEIEAAIAQYLETQHVYADPPSGLRSVIAHCWVWRNRILWSAAGLALAGGGLWYFFS